MSHTIAQSAIEPAALPMATATTLDDVRPGDMIGLNRALTPARTATGARHWRTVTASHTVSPGRHRVTLAFNAGDTPVTAAPHMPVIVIH